MPESAHVSGDGQNSRDRPANSSWANGRTAPWTIPKQLFTLADVVKAFEGKDFGQIIQTFTQLEFHYGLDAGGRIEGDTIEPVKFLLNKAMEHCQSAGLKVSGKALDEIEDQLTRGGLTYGQLQTQLGEVTNTMRRELSTILLLAVAPDREDLFRNIQPFGAMVATAFPGIAFDVEEAGKCLALDRGTATVFHLMRIMEDGLKYLASLLSIPYAPSWESYISQITTQVTQKHKHKKIKWKRDEPFFKGILGDLEAIKIAWRNPTMHIVRTYSDSEADDVFRAVRTFMRQLAVRKIAQRG